jgi:uncharacterized protein YbbC (DUF1343 family)
LLGAPWVHGVQLAAYLNQRAIPGVRFAEVRFTPRSGLHQGVACEGVSLVITGRAELRAMRLGLELAAALWKLYPQHFEVEKTVTLLGSAATVARIQQGDDPAAIVSGWTDELAAFRELREKYLLYD